MASKSEIARTSEGYIWDVSLGILSKGLLSPAVRKDSAATYPKHYDAIVIGAGFVGLSAARDLSVAGKQVLLLEARDRIGGRTWVAEGKNHTYEMGGGWVHWLQTHIWSELTRYGLTDVQATLSARMGSLRLVGHWTILHLLSSPWKTQLLGLLVWSLRSSI